MNRPDTSLPWGTIAAIAAAGVLLLAYFVGRSGSSVGLTAALLIALVLGVAAVAGYVRNRPASRQSRWRGPVTQQTVQRDPAPVPTSRAPAAHPDARASDSPNPPDADDAPDPPEAHPARPSSSAARTARALSVEALRGSVEEVARGIAGAAMEEVRAPAAAVLVPLEGKLTSAGSAGDWAAARRGLTDLAAPALYDPEADGGDPPAFPLDPRGDELTRLLAMYGRPIPLERWEELSDVPWPFVPLMGLAASGVGAAVPLGVRGRLVGLWVVAQRPDGGPYTDDELAALRRLASGAARALASAR